MSDSLQPHESQHASLSITNSWSSPRLEYVGKWKKEGLKRWEWVGWAGGVWVSVQGSPLPFLGQEGHTWPMREQAGVPWGGPTSTSGKSQRKDSHPSTFILSALSPLHGHHHKLNGFPWEKQLTPPASFLCPKHTLQSVVVTQYTQMANHRWHPLSVKQKGRARTPRHEGGWPQRLPWLDDSGTLWMDWGRFHPFHLPSPPLLTPTHPSDGTDLPDGWTKG